MSANIFIVFTCLSAPLLIIIPDEFHFSHLYLPFVEKTEPQFGFKVFLSPYARSHKKTIRPVNKRKMTLTVDELSIKMAKM